MPDPVTFCFILATAFIGLFYIVAFYLGSVRPKRRIGSARANPALGPHPHEDTEGDPIEAARLVDFIRAEQGEMIKARWHASGWDGIEPLGALETKVNAGSGCGAGIMVPCDTGFMIYTGPFRLVQSATSEQMLLFECTSAVFVEPQLTGNHPYTEAVNMAKIRDKVPGIGRAQSASVQSPPSKEALASLSDSDAHLRLSGARALVEATEDFMRVHPAVASHPAGEILARMRFAIDECEDGQAFSIRPMQR